MKVTIDFEVLEQCSDTTQDYFSGKRLWISITSAHQGSVTVIFKKGCFETTGRRTLIARQGTWGQPLHTREHQLPIVEKEILCKEQLDIELTSLAAMGTPALRAR